MTKRQTRLFFLGGTLLFALIFAALTYDSHRQFPALTHSDRLTPEVAAGFEVWHRFDCVNCHTLLGEGAYYAPDLTNIASQRGAAYLKQFLKDPSRFYSEEQDRRLMPTLDLSDREIDEVVAFLAWVDGIDTNGWPPRPLTVRGAAVPGSDVGGAAPSAASSDPVAQGEALFASSPPGCFTCHSTTKGVSIVGPSLAGIATKAAEIVRNPDYTGSAATAADYIRESILEPSAYLVTGANYSTNGMSIMPGNFGEQLDSTQVSHLVQYLLTLQ